jgi:hypothetical protein
LDDKPATKKVFPANAIHMVRTTQQIHVQLSAMADHKASILMGATFVIFTITIGQARQAEPPIPLLILGAAAFFSAVFAVLAILPATPLPQSGAHQPALLRLRHAAAAGGISRRRPRSAVPPMKPLPDHGASDIYQNASSRAQEVPDAGYAYRIFLAPHRQLRAFLVETLVW